MLKDLIIENNRTEKEAQTKTHNIADHKKGTIGKIQRCLVQNKFLATVRTTKIDTTAVTEENWWVHSKLDAA